MQSMPSRPVETLGQRLKLARTRLGLTQGQLADAAGEKQPNISKLELGTIQETAAIARLADALGVSARWLERGDENGAPDWTPEQHSPTGSGLPSVDHQVSHHKFEDAPTTIAWERILFEQLKGEFQTVMPDSSMEPDVPRGARVIFITGADPAPGDWVLCTDGDGNLYLREMRQLKPGRWEAHALNPAFLPLDSERDKLNVVAVFDGLRGRKARV